MTSIHSNGSNDGDKSVNSGEGTADEPSKPNAQQAKLNAIAQNTIDAEGFVEAGTKLYENITALLDDQTESSDQRFETGNNILHDIRQVLLRRIKLSVHVDLEDSLQKRVDELDIQLKSLFPGVRKREAAWKAKYGRQELRSRYAGSDRPSGIPPTSGGSTFGQQTMYKSIDGGIGVESHLVPSFGATSLNK